MLKYFVNSMTSRFFFILLGGTLASAALTLVLAAYESKDVLEQVRMRHLTERIEQMLLTLEVTPENSRQKFAEIVAKSGVQIHFASASDLTRDLDSAVVDTEFTKALSKVLGENRKIATFKRFNIHCPVRPDLLGKADLIVARQCRTITANLQDGTLVSMDIASPPDKLPLPFHLDFVPYLLIFLVCVAALAFIIAHLAAKPIRTLAQAAHELGKNLERPHLSEDKGPMEVREAASAFNNMQSQIRHFVEERAYMLAAIAHDLQTPLTRLRLRLEKVTDEELRAKLVNDLSVTQDIVKEGLELARSFYVEEPFELMDMDSLIETICTDATDAGLDVTHSGKVEVPVMVRPNAIRRCLLNLIDNAVKYGEFAHITLKREGAKVSITIIDGGPGIPEHQLQKVLQPFMRLEDSRSRTSGGTGLGLTIANNIAEKHRGTLRLRNINDEDFGLEVTLEMLIA